MGKTMRATDYARKARAVFNFNYTASLKAINKKLESLNEKLVSVEGQLTSSKAALEDIRKEAQLRRRHDDAMRNIAMLPIFEEMRREYLPKQLGLLETVRKVAKDDLSFVRVGDGELKLALDLASNIGFQKNSADLNRDLNEAMLGSQNREDVLFGTPHMHRDRHWSMIWARVWPEFREIIESASFLGNAHVSRPMFFSVEGEAGVDAWRSVWRRKKVTVITGKSSRFDLIPQLFDNVTSANRIDSLDRHAYSDLPRIMSEVDSATETELFLVALGPAGTVLTKQIADTGRQAVDIGHISDSYLVAFEGGARPESRAYSQPRQ